MTTHRTRDLKQPNDVDASQQPADGPTEATPDGVADPPTTPNEQPDARPTFPDGLEPV